MSINFCEVCLAVFICSIITIVLYVVSLCETNEKQKKAFKEADSSNIQGLENDRSIPRGQLNETLNFDSEHKIQKIGYTVTGEIKREESDLRRLNDEDLRARIAKNESGDHHSSDDSVSLDQKTKLSEYDPVVHPDSKVGRLHLSIRYDDERSKLIVQIVDAQGLIRPEQSFSLDMCLTFTLISPYNHDDETEKHKRIITDNAVVSWKEPMTFSITLENAMKQNLYVIASNTMDPAAVRDRDVSISLKNLDNQTKEINGWFDLQYVQSSY